MPGETQGIDPDFYFVSLVSLFLEECWSMSHKEVINDSFLLTSI